MGQMLPSLLKRSADRLLSYAKKAPEGLEKLRPFEAVRMIRRKLGMTQTQLAKRTGLSQSHIAQIEKGRIDPQWGTLTKIFAALYCDLVVAPKPRTDLDALKAELMQKAAQKRIRQLEGTMALEEQHLDQQARQDLLREVAIRRLKKHSSDIWDT